MPIVEPSQPTHENTMQLNVVYCLVMYCAEIVNQRGEVIVLRKSHRTAGTELTTTGCNAAPLCCRRLEWLVVWPSHFNALGLGPAPLPFFYLYTDTSKSHFFMYQ